jgi:hypothetical protein
MMCENIGSFEVINESPAEEPLVGGLSDLPSETSARKEEDLPAEVTPFDPINLLNMETMDVADFFKLDREVVYSRLNRLQSLPNDNPAKLRATKILQLLEDGKEAYCSKNVEAKTVNF